MGGSGSGRPTPRSLSPGARAAAVASVNGCRLTDEQEELLLDVGQMVLDLIGIFEPTPFADTTNAVVSVARDDWTGAGLSLIGVVPFVGDAAKAGRFPKYLSTLSNAIREARGNARFGQLLRPLLLRLHSALDMVPAGSMPQDARRVIFDLRRRIADFLGPAARVARGRAVLARLRLRVSDPDKVLDMLGHGLSKSSAPVEGFHAADMLEEVLGHVGNFDGVPTLRVTRNAELAARASDVIGPPVIDPKSGKTLLDASDMGRYLVPGKDIARAADRGASSVPVAWNKMSMLEIQEIPAGSLVLEGVTRPQAGKPGGGRQVAHLGQISTTGTVSRPAERRILDGKTRLLGGKLIGDH